MSKREIIETIVETSPLLKTESETELCGDGSYDSSEGDCRLQSEEMNGDKDVLYDIHTSSGSHYTEKSADIHVDVAGAKTTNLECLMHVLKGNIGVGILALPVAYKNGGLWLSLAFLTFLGITCTHCMHILVRSANELCKRTNSSHLDYASVMETALKIRRDRLKMFSSFTRKTVNMFLITTQLGVCCTYYVFIADNVKQVIHYAVPVASLDARFYILMAAAALVPYAMVKSLKILAPFSAFANVLNLIGFVLVMVNLCEDLPDVRTRPSVADAANIPLFFGQVMFAIEGITLVLPLHNKMKNQEAFLGKAGVLNLGLTIIVVLDNAVGFYGYLKYGDDTQGSITLNLPDDQWLYLSVKLLFATSIYITYAIQFYVPIEIIWHFVYKKSKTNGKTLPGYIEYVIRFLLVLLTCGLSTLIPHLDLLIALIGACESSFIALIFPAFLELITFNCNKIVYFKNSLIIALGLLGFVTGTYSAIVEIVKTF